MYTSRELYTNRGIVMINYSREAVCAYKLQTEVRIHVCVNMHLCVHMCACPEPNRYH